MARRPIVSGFSGLLLLSEARLTASEAPEELLHGRVQGALVERIDDLLTLTLVNDQVCVAEDRQMTRDRRLREIKLSDDLADVALLVL